MPVLVYVGHLWLCPTSDGASVDDCQVATLAPNVYFWAGGNHPEGDGACQVEKFVSTSRKVLLATSGPNL